MAAEQTCVQGEKSRGLSRAMQEAQVRLLQLQAESRVRRAGVGMGHGVLAPDAGDKGATPLSAGSPSMLGMALAQLPPHLGWDSTAVSQLLRQPPRQSPPPLVSAAERPSAPAPPTSPTTVRLHPSLAVAMLRQNVVTSGRVWLLLRHLDVDGRGWWAQTAVQQHLAAKAAPFRLCGQRQLRNLLREGEGVFWVRRNGRLWLRSVANVAAALGVTRLQGQAVALPIAILTEPIGTVRAHFYASFHSGRQPQTAAAAPIARTTIATLTSVSPRIQRRYEARTGVQTQINLAIGPQQQAADAQEMAWQHGRSARIWTDTAGTQGPAGRRYWVWQLPNSYRGPHVVDGRTARKRINRTLTDLPHSGTAGNGDGAIERRFFANGRYACTTTARQTWRYWRGPKRGGCQHWHPLAPEKRQQ